MKHAFLITAYQHHDQLRVLLQLLDHQDCDIYVHVDKADTTFDENVFTGVCRQSRVTFIPRIKVTWGDYTQVLAEMNLLQEALQQGEYDYFHLLSGQDLPIKPMSEIMAFFEKHRGQIFVDCNDEKHDENPLRFSLRYDVFHPFQKYVGKGRSFIKGRRGLKYVDFGIALLQHYLGVSRTRKSNLTIKSGANWFSIPADFATYLNNQRQVILRFCRYGYCVDEVFVATWLYNSPFYKRVYRHSYYRDSILRRYKWQDHNPTLVTIADLKEYEREPDALFARKFDVRVDAEPVQYLLSLIKEG